MNRKGKSRLPSYVREITTPASDVERNHTDYRYIIPNTKTVLCRGSMIITHWNHYVHIVIKKNITLSLKRKDYQERRRV